MHLIKKLKYNRVLQISSRLYSEFSNNMQSCLTRYQKQSRSNILPSSYPKKKKKVFASWGSLSAQESVLQNSSVVERHLGFKKTATVQGESLRAEDEKNFPLFLAPCVLCCKCFFFFLDGFCVVKEKKIPEAISLPLSQLRSLISPSLLTPSPPRRSRRLSVQPLLVSSPPPPSPFALQ